MEDPAVTVMENFFRYYIFNNMSTAYTMKNMCKLPENLQYIQWGGKLLESGCVQ